MNKDKMQLRQKLMLFSFVFFVVSCSNYGTYKEIKSMYPREDVEIEELIRVDGYFYESSEEVYSPLVFTRYGEVKNYFFQYNSHEDIHKNSRNLSHSPGYYTINQDTLKIKWAWQVYRGQYRIHEEYFVALNDTTLQRVFHTIDGEERKYDEGSDIYKFYPFDVSELK